MTKKDKLGRGGGRFFQEPNLVLQKKITNTLRDLSSPQKLNITFCVHLLAAAYEVSTLYLNTFICSIFYFCFKSEIECSLGPGLAHTINQMIKHFSTIYAGRDRQGALYDFTSSGLLRQTGKAFVMMLSNDDLSPGIMGCNKN